MFRSTITRLAIASALSLSLLAAPLALRAAYAQTPSNPAPYNVDLGALITNTLRVAGTTTSSLQANTNWRGVVCTLAQTASSGSSSTSFGIDAYDAATLTYRRLIEISAILGQPSEALNRPYSIVVYPGVQTTGLPNYTSAVSLHLPRSWRVSQTIGSGTGASTPAMTGKIGCNYLL